MNDHDNADNPVTADPWQQLRRLTRARIALGHSGASQPTAAHLAFQFAHAKARDAVHATLDGATLVDNLDRLGLPCCEVESEAADRVTYLTRPDLGRRLSARAIQRLEKAAGGVQRPDLAIVLADGLSSRAVQDHGIPMLERLLKIAMEHGWSVAPVVIANQARVALGDDIGERLQARMLIMLIGERPGLSSPDSLGAYLTFAPRKGLHDDARNCVSNIRPEGLTYGAAAFRLGALMAASFSRQLSGVSLKDDSEPMPVTQDKAEIGNFLMDQSDRRDQHSGK
ncbi:MAG: ethanolamine ammonia-lyase subunit EutC [Marinobacter sp.]